MNEFAQIWLKMIDNGLILTDNYGMFDIDHKGAFA
jgi:hypothetical protein